MRDLHINLKGIIKSYDRPILKAIDLEIDSDSFIAIIGKSGSGKSTLMNILGLIETFDEGEYLFNNIAIDNKKDYSSLRLERIGFVFQNYNLIATLTCKENILLPTIYYDKTPKNFQLLTEQLDIQNLLDTSVNVLSGGEKQRVAIARALILDPQIIIADEPTGNLDEENKNIVLELLSKVHKSGCAVVIITHDLSVAQTAKKIFELRNGILYEKA